MHPGLDLLTLVWNGPWQALQAALNALDAAGYESRVPILLRLGGIPPLRLLVPGRDSAFVRAWLPEREGAPLSLAELTTTLLEWHESAALGALAALLQDTQPRELRALQQVAAAHATELPPEFAQALNAAMARSATGGAMAGLKRWLRS